MNLVIAVATCRTRRNYADAQRETWVPGFSGLADVEFFIGGEGSPERDDEIVLPVPDDYAGLPAKVQEICRWALRGGHDYLIKLDDDVYCRPALLLSPGCEQHDYFGHVNGTPPGWCSGFCYSLSRRAMEIVASSALPIHSAEDRWVAECLGRSGIKPTHTDEFVIAQTIPRLLALRDSRAAALCEFSPKEMRAAHNFRPTLREYGSPAGNNIFLRIQRDHERRHGKRL